MSRLICLGSGESDLRNRLRVDCVTNKFANNLNSRELPKKVPRF